MVTMTQIAGAERIVFGGVDTHLDTHTVAAITDTGQLLGISEFPADPAGYARLTQWLHGFGQIATVGVEGTGAYGAGLTRHLTAAGVRVIEVDRPDRAARRRVGKSDPVDAENAARAVLSGRASGHPKRRDGNVEALRNLRIARRAAVDARANTIRRIKSMLITAPDPIRDQFRGLRTRNIMTTALHLRPDPAAVADGDVTAAVKLALRSLARTHRHLSEQIAELDQLILPLVATICPALLAVHGIGPDVAGQLLVTAGDNPDRIHSEAAFAMLCGVAPIPASSGQTHRHRLNRGGDRQANRALWAIAITRIATDPNTRDYIARRTRGDNHRKRDAIRNLKRHIARQIYPILTA